MLQYSIFFRKHVVRKMDELLDPPMESINNFALPRDSILHYISDVPGDMGINADDPFLNEVEKTVMVEHVLELREQAGPPKKTTAIATSLVKDYHRKNRKLRPLRKMETALRDERVVIVVNYALLTQLWRYTNNIYLDYNRWYNISATVWDKVNELASTKRHQFIPMTLPQRLPSYSELRKAEEGKLNKTILDIFSESASLDMLDLFKWLGDHRDQSTMSRLQVENLERINIVFNESGRFFVVNLGLLNGWRKLGDNDSEENVDDGKVSPEQLQRKVLKMLMILFEMRTAGASDAAVLEFTEGKEVSGDGETDPDALPGKAKTGHEKQTEQEKLTEGERVSSGKVPTDEEVDREIAEMDAVTENLNKRQQTFEESQEYVPPTQNLEESVMEAADVAVEAGMLSAAEYRRMAKLSKKYQDIPNPFGEGTLKDLTEISQEELKLDTTNPMVDELNGVTDKSMLSNSIAEMDARYNTEIYHKDIAGAVMAIQKGGVAIQNYTVEKVEEHLNDYEIHTVKVVPVTGAPSTIRFRVPIIDRDGVFKANGVKQRLRKQRGDMPIRKTSPSEVALSSYYGKLFVNRSERAVHNYERWLTQQVTNKGLDSEDESVTELRFSNVFDPSIKLPRTYSLMAKTFSSFISGQYFFYFNYVKRKERFDPERVEKAEKDGLVFCGTKGTKTSLLMDDVGNIYTVAENGTLTQEGIIEEIIGLELAKRPVEILELGVFGKPIPIGIVLAYEMGLNNLIRHLKLTPRRVARGSRLQLEDDEFVVRFEDESLIFDRSNKMAEFIMGSFNRYHREIKRHSLYNFDKKDVYQVVLEKNGLGARYVREMGMMYKMFVDHITLEVLESIGEPTDLAGLLLRAAELLMTDDHPSESDMRFMRDKGYERVSGIIYEELVRALRGFKSKPANATATVDMNPQAVWQTILQDPAGMPIKESNPIHNLKEKEVVVFSGHGGRGKRSMTARHRTYDNTNMGVTSEATSDSGDVATLVYLTADPKYNSLRGTTDPYVKEEDGAARLVSPSMMISPGADRDDH